ncbi:MAG: hypothetical protein HYY16_19760 [Planctomycetes bacterium]|nr:hypothetical protein [Planctomycetota bacterium]
MTRWNQETARELLRLAKENGRNCFICRRIAEESEDRDGEFAPLRLGAMVLEPGDQVLHLRGCTADFMRRAPQRPPVERAN